MSKRIEPMKPAPPIDVERSACGKVILCGEHAVVYGRPAIALPLPHLRARARIEWGEHNRHRAFEIVALDINSTIRYRRALPAHGHAKRSNPLRYIAQLTLDFLHRDPPTATMTVTSDIPVASNLGSGAAVSVACARAIAAYFGCELSPTDASALAYEVEKIHHGTPSGIDNTVIAYEQPVWFVRSAPPSPLEWEGTPAKLARGEERLSLVIADTGISTPTRIPVGDVRAGWERDHDRYEGLFNAIASLVTLAREALLQGDWPRLGEVMNANHILLQQLDVSCRELDLLCDAARAAGALGAKMSGGGRGGNMIALARDSHHAEALRQALLAAGAKRVLV